MVANTTRLESYSVDGQNYVLSYLDSASGIRKCLEDPFNPESEALETLAGSLKDVSALIIPPCSARTINALKEAAPDLSSVIVADHDSERLALWGESYGSLGEGLETLALPVDPAQAEKALRERLMRFECDIFLGRLCVYIPQRFRRFDKDFAKFLEEKVLYLQRESCSAAATRSLRSWRHTLNQLLNSDVREVHRIDEDAQEKPQAVVVVGAGPSLDENIKELKEFSEKAIIISTDAALNTMLENGVRPSLVASMDSGPLMWRLFERNLDKLGEIPLAASQGSFHRLFKDYPGKVALYARPGEGLRLAEGLPVVEHGQCVGHFAFHIAESLKPETIVMLGFDLAYRDGRMHTAAMPYQGFADFKKSYESTSSFVESVDGGMVKTDLSLEFFLRYFENAIASCRAKVVDATGAGALKRGARIASLAETLSALPVAPKLPLVPNPLFSPKEKRALKEVLKTSLKSLAGKLETIKSEAEAMTPATLRNPLKELPFDSEEYSIVSSCANFLLMAEWSALLKSRKNLDFKRFKSVLLALSEDLRVSAETLVAALDVSAPWPRDPRMALALRPEGLPDSLFNESLAKLAPGAAVFDSSAPLHSLWRELVERRCSKVVCYDGATAPELWSVPGLACVDIRSKTELGAHDKSLWLPGYSVACLDVDTARVLRASLPQSVPCELLEESPVHA